jgi:hypothetical protein
MSSQIGTSGFLFDTNEVNFSKSKWFIIIPGFFWILIYIINYGLGNLNSIANMIKRVGGESVICNDPAAILIVDKIIQTYIIFLMNIE